MTACDVLAIKSTAEVKGYTIIQVTNLSTKASDKQITELFGQIGAVTHVEIFPKDKHRNKYGVLVAFVEFEEANSVFIAQHLTSTVFIDKPIVVMPVSLIPSEYEALQLAAAMATTIQDDHEITKQLVPTIAPTIPSNIANPILGNKPQSNLLVAGLIQTKEHLDSSKFVAPNVELIAATGVPIPRPPKLIEDYSLTKEKEARRTVFIDNLNPYLTAEHILNYFQFCGDIRYLRIGGDDMQDKRFAFIQFVDLASVNVALQYDGADFCEKRIRIIHSRHWLQKPPTKRTDAERENDLLMKRLMEAQARIENACKEEPAGGEKKDSSPKRRRSRSTSKSRRKHRSRSRSKRKSRSRDRSKSRKSKKGRRRTRSRERKRSRSGSRSRRRSKSRDRRKRSRSTSRSRR